jgi:uncharacterized protein
VTLQVRRSPASDQQTNIRFVILEEHFTPHRSYSERPRRPPALAAFEGVEAKILDLDEGRLNAMDEGGVDVQVLYPAAMGQESLAPGCSTDDGHDLTAARPASVGLQPRASRCRQRSSSR